MPDDDPLTTTREYLHVQPSDEPLHPDAVTRSITRLHRIEDGGLLGDDTVPTYELLITATGDTGPAGDRQLEWYVGVDAGDRATLERALRNALPRSVDLTETELAYGPGLDLPLDTDTTAPLDDWTVAGLEWEGVGERADDWQLPLQELATFDADERAGAWPLATLCDGLATSDAPALVQLLVTPKPDWSRAAHQRRLALRSDSDTLRGEIVNAVTVEDDGDTTTTYRDDDRRTDHDTTTTTRPRSGRDSTSVPSNAVRLDALETVDSRQSFVVNARAVAFGTDAHTPARTLRAIETAFDPLGGAHYRVEATTHAAGSAAANDVLARLCRRTTHTDPTSWRHRLPLTRNASPAIVADPSSVGAFLLTDGPALTPEARRALAPTPAERTGIELPPRRVLDTYLDGPGMHVGPPVTSDRTTLDAEFSLPPAVQPLHTALFGATGTGKTALGQRMQLTNHDATDGATVYLDSKGDGSPETFAKTYFARHDDLEAVRYFDCDDYLPVLELLSLEPYLDAGFARERAVNVVAETYVETLAAASDDDFGDAPAAIEAIELVVRALFDPVHGADVVSQQAVLDAIERLRDDDMPPPVADGTLHRKLLGIGGGATDMTNKILNAAHRRVGRVTNDGRLAPLFAAPPEDRAFDLAAHLDDDCVIVLDVGGYGDRTRRVLGVALLGQLWGALERRAETTDDPPLVSCYVEEAADIAATGILDTLLAQGRAFGLAVTLAMQFPEQVRAAHPRVYAELLNDVGTIVAGGVGVDDRLAERLATGDRDADAVAARLRELDRGEWLVRPAAPFADRAPQPFQVTSGPLPPGHPEGDEPLSETRQALFRAEFVRAKERTRTNHGVDVGRQSAGAPDPVADDADAGAADGSVAAAMATLPHTSRLPDHLTYVEEPPFPLQCETCDTRYPATSEGMRGAVGCHPDGDVDRDSVPIAGLDGQLTAGELAASDYSAAQLRFLVAVYMAHQQRFDPALEYDLVWDSMTDLRDDVGLDTDGVQALVDDGLLTVDTTRPHPLYTVTPAGRDAIRVTHREGVAHGHGQGDLSESSLHVAMTEVGARLLAQQYVGPDAPGDRLSRYHDVDGGRLDAAVLDTDGQVVAALEAERINNDRAEAIPSDFDTMAACEPEAAWWIVKRRADGHAVLSALHDPPDGDPRVGRTYSAGMAPRQYTLDTPGLTEVYTFEHARSLLDAEGPSLEGPRPP